MTDVVRSGTPDAELAWLVHVVARVVGALAPERVEVAEPDQALVADLGYDSMRLVELAFAMEDLCGLEPATVDDAPPIGTVRDLQEYVLAKAEVTQCTVPTPESVEEFLSTV